MGRMIAVTDYAGIAVLVTALGTFVVACATAFVTVRVHREVKTFNETPLGRLAANTETRRVEAIDHDERTAMEQRHVDEAPPADPPQGPGR